MSEKVVIVGANLEGLEIMALMRKDPQVEVVALVDPDKEALAFNLQKYGYRYSEGISVSFYHDLQRLREMPEIDIIIDSSEDASLHQKLYQFSPPGVRIMKGSSAKLIWKMRFSLEVEGEEEVPQGRFSSQQSLSLNLFLETANSLDLAHNPEEFYHLLLNVGLQGSGGNAGSLMVMSRNRNNLLMVAQEGLSQAISRKPELRFPKIGEGIAGRVAQIGEALLLSGNYDDLRYRHLQEEEGIKSVISVPIKIRESVFGVISVGHNSFTDAFSRQHLAFLTELATKSAKYLAEIRTYQELQDSRDEQALRGAISNIWDSPLSIREKLQQSVKKISEGLKIDSCDLYLKDPYSSVPEVSLQASLQIKPNLFGLITSRDYQGTVGKVLKLKRPLLLKEYASEASGDKTEVREEFLYLLPLIVNLKLLGVINFHFSGDPNLTDQLLAHCREVSDFLAQRIYQELERERWQQKTLKISAINESGMDLINISNEEKLYSVVIAFAAQLLEAEMCIIRLYEESSNKLSVRSSYGFKDPQVYKEVLKFDGRICSEVFKSKLPLVVPDLSTSPQYRVDESSPLKTVLCSPLSEERAMLGTLSLYNKIEDKSLFPPQFTMDDRAILGKLVSYASKAIANLQELKRRKPLHTIDELTGMFNERYLRHRLLEETQRADRYKREFSLLVLKIEGLDNLAPNKQKRLTSHIAAELEKLFRTSDILFHLSPDRFAIIFPEIGNQIKDVIKRLISHFSSKPIEIEEDFLPVNLSAGYSSYPISAFSVDEIISQASSHRQSFTIDSSHFNSFKKNISSS